MKHILSSLLLALLFLLSIEAVRAQSPRLYANLQGLADTRINHVAFDSDNFLWVSTSLGLSRFDGQSFTNYTNEPNNPHALSDNHVTFMHEAPDGTHWVGSSDGLYYFCRTENRFERYAPDWVDFTINITSIIDHPTRQNALIMSTAGYGLWVFDIEKRVFDKEETQRITDLIWKRNITQITADKANHIWAFFHNGFRVLDIESTKVIQGNLTNEQQDNLIVQSVVSDPLRNCVYLGTASGLFRASLPDLSLEELGISDLKGKNISALCLNPQGQLVVGTEGQGLYLVNPYTLETHLYEHEDCPIDLAHSKIHSITYNKQRDLCLGIYQKGILIWPPQNSLFSYSAIHSSESQFNMGCVTAFASHPNGSRIYGIDGGGIVVRDREGKQHHLSQENSPLETNAIMDLATTPEGDIFVATYLHGIYRLNVENKKIDRLPNLHDLDKTSIMSMAYDVTAHNLYIGTNGSGTYSYNTETHSLRHVTNDEAHRWVVKLFLDRHQQLWGALEGSMCCYNIAQDSMHWIGRPTSVRTFGFAESPDGELWFATDKGLFTYDEKLDSMIIEQAQDRLYDEAFMAIQRSDDGRLWLSSNHGLVSYNPHDKQTIRYTDLEIASIGSFCARSSIRWSDGSLSFGGDNGILSFVPEKVTSYSRPRQPINFTRLWINNEVVDYNPNLSVEDNVLDAALWKASRLTLESDANNFSIAFALQEYIDPLGIRYSYMLEGYDSKWLDVHDFNATANYSSLPAGNYTFKVKAWSGGADPYEVIKVLQVNVLPHWYSTWWAYLLYAVIAILLIVFVYLFVRNRQHEKRIMQRAEQSRQIKEAKLKMFASVSHEIQTPITLLIAPLRQLMNRKNDNATQDTLELMYRNALRILMLVNQQLDIRKLDRGLLHLHMQEMCLRSFLEEQLHFFEHISSSRQISVTLDIAEENRELSIWADSEQIDKVFFNLLSNAFKFAPEQGEVRIGVVADETKKQCSVSIFNSGSHLSEKDQAEAFSGIGLGLARELTELHHGTLTVANNEYGITFMVNLPLGKEHLTEEELAPAKNGAHEMVADNTVTATEKSQTIISQEDSTKEKQLAKALSEELHRKKQLQERRTKLGFDYSEMQISSADQKLLDRVVETIRQNLGNSDFNVENLGDEIGISRVHLNRKLKELIDTTPSALIKTTRLKQAAFMLTQPNISVSEVAYAVGFSSPAYFATNFTQYFGMTPKEFVNTYNKNPESELLKKLLE